MLVSNNPGTQHAIQSRHTEILASSIPVLFRILSQTKRSKLRQTYSVQPALRLTPRHTTRTNGVEPASKPAHSCFALLGFGTRFIVRVPSADSVSTRVVWKLTGSSACGTAVYKIPLQYHFFEEADFSGKGAWYYIWQQ
jgi:hypothetical protein